MEEVVNNNQNNNNKPHKKHFYHHNNHNRNNQNNENVVKEESANNDSEVKVNQNQNNNFKKHNNHNNHNRNNQNNENAVKEEQVIETKTEEIKVNENNRPNNKNFKKYNNNNRFQTSSKSEEETVDEEFNEFKKEQDFNHADHVENNQIEEKAITNRKFAFIYGVAFKKAFQTYYFGYDEDNLKVNDKVVVETVRGMEIGTIKIGVRSTLEVKIYTPLKPILRVATKEDIANATLNEENEAIATETFNEAIKEQNLDMHLVSCEYTLDSSKVIFTYIADDRVDFRELLKVLASKLHCRIELRQIGARDRAKVIGGLGPCGLPLCCSTFLSDFEGISINMAKNQLLALNIAKLSGQCGKLTCCLKYEDSIYSDLRVGLPKIGLRVLYNNEEYKITSMNVLSKTMRLENKENGVSITFDEYFKDVKNAKTTELPK